MSDKNETADEGSNTTLERDERDIEIEKLRAKNKELLAEKQKAKQKAQDAQDAADEAVTQAAERNGDIEALKAAHAKEMKKLQDKLDAVDGDLRTIRVDNEITKALTEGKVIDYQLEPLTYMFKSKVQYENGTASIDGKPVADFIGEYLNSDVGANFRRATDNSGAGATGNTSTATPMRLNKRPGTQQEWDYLDSLGTVERNALCDSIGAPDLKL